MDPIISSLISIVVVFIVVALIMQSVKPNFISKVDTDGKKVVLMDKLLAYSSLIAVSVGLVVAVGMNMIKPQPVRAGMRSYFSVEPDYGMRHYSCGC